MAVRKRGDRWWYDFTIEGVRYRKPIPEARTKRKAEEVEDRIKVSIYEGTYKRPQAKTLSEFIDEIFLPWAKANYQSRPSTYESAIRALRAHLGHLALGEFSVLAVERFKRERVNEKTKRGKDRKPDSVNRELTTLSRILSMAVQCGLIRENPCKEVKWFRSESRRTRYMTEEEERLILDYLDGSSPQSANAVRLALNTGLRRGEIVSLEWGDLDFSQSRIHIRKSKNGKGRSVPINSEAAKVFERQRQRAADGPRVFTICSERMTAAFRKATVKLGIVNLRLHDTRHSAATRMGNAGIDVFTIAELLGHSDLKQTRGYTHALEESKRRAVKALEARSNVTNLSQHREEKAG